MDERSAVRGVGVPEWLPEALASGGVGTWCWDLATDSVTCSLETYVLFGHEPSSEPLTIGEVVARLHADDRERVVA